MFLTRLSRRCCQAQATYTPRGADGLRVFTGAPWRLLPGHMGTGQVHFSRPNSNLCPDPHLNPDSTIGSQDQRSLQVIAPPTEEIERSRFQEFHGVDDTSSFSSFVRQVGLEKVRDYHDKLDEHFSTLAGQGVPRHVCIFGWKGFVIEKSMKFKSFKEVLRLDEEQHPDQIRQLLRLAYFQRYPDRGSSIVYNETMVTAIEAPTHTGVEGTSDWNSLRLDWSADIVKAGYSAEYRKSDLIVEPNLARLRLWATEWSRKIHEAPFTSIIGPTGSGKTRLILELAKHVCVVYIRVRPPTSTGQPPRSSLAEALLPPDHGLKSNLHLHYSCFLAAILEVVADFFSMAEIKEQKPADQLAAWFDYSFQIDERKKKPDMFSFDVQTKMKALSAMTSTNMTENLVWGATEKMYKSMKLLNNGPLKLVLAIEEARSLLTPEDEALKISYFRIFRRVLSQIPESMGFFAVFTDPTSWVAKFAPAPNKDPSLRIPGVGYKLFPPIYQIATLDLMAKPIPQSWNDLLLPDRLLSYGSPFYGLYFDKAIQLTGRPPMVDTMGLAISKLLGDTTYPPAHQLSESQVFALLGSTINTRPTSSEINSALISSHAAHCMYISPSRDLIISYYPSQFVYASAANAFLASDDKIMVVCINTLATAMQNGLISLGDAGEMVTRIILLRAMHKTKRILCNGEYSIPYGYSVRLEDFLVTLTGKEPQQLDLGGIGKNKQTKLLQHGRIFFNHFIPIEYTPNATDFLELLYRGLAVQCTRGHPGLDQLFPIYLAPNSKSPNTDKLDHTNISFCGIQTKNQISSIDWARSPGIQDIQNPYLIILFSLRSESAPKRMSMTERWKEPSGVTDKGRAYLEFFGLDCIACLTPEIRDALRRLINATPVDILPLHERDSKIDSKPLDAPTSEWIRRQNPMFYHKDDRINVYPTDARTSRKNTKRRPKKTTAASN